MGIQESLKFSNLRVCRLMVFFWVLLLSSILCQFILSAVRALAQTTSSESSAVSIRVPDAELIDQDGRTVHLYSDLVKGRKVVVINTMFTTCGTICPLIGVRMSHLQESLGACGPNDYSLISITVDPATDTPERLRNWEAKFASGPCWKLLTGPKSEVDAALRTLHLLPPDKTSHTPSALIGRDGADDWTLFDVLASQEKLLQIVRMKMSTSVAQKGTK